MRKLKRDKRKECERKEEKGKRGENEKEGVELILRKSSLYSRFFPVMMFLTRKG